MRLRLEVPEHWARLEPGVAGPRPGEGTLVYQVAPGVTFIAEPLRPLPADLRAWGDGVVLAGIDRSMYRVRNVEDVQTLRGWPVSLFASDIISILPESPALLDSSLHAPLFFGGFGAGVPATAGPAVLERRLHALYRFGETCGVAIARSQVPARFDAVLPEVRRVVLTAEPDWSGDRILALADLWRGLALKGDDGP